MPISLLQPIFMVALVFVAIGGVMLFARAIVTVTWRQIEAVSIDAEPAPDAVWRKFQSFSFGMSNFGGCVHVYADADCLHLRPIWLARLFGLTNVSIPWSEISPGGWKAFGSMQAQINGVKIRGPRWCLELAEAGRPAD